MSPDTFQEDEYKGKPVCRILYGFWKDEPQFLVIGVKKAAAILENIDRLRQWVDKNEKGGNNG